MFHDTTCGARSRASLDWTQSSPRKVPDVPEKHTIECERKAAVLRLKAARATDPALQTQLLAMAERYETIARSLRELHDQLKDIGTL
jgi:aminoglycoside phosphotransferase